MHRTANEPQPHRKARVAALSPDLLDRAHRAGPELRGHNAFGVSGQIGLRPVRDALRRRDGLSASGVAHRHRRTPREALALARDVLVTLAMLATCAWLGWSLGAAS